VLPSRRATLPRSDHEDRGLLTPLRPRSCLGRAADAQCRHPISAQPRRRQGSPFGGFDAHSRRSGREGLRFYPSACRAGEFLLPRTWSPTKTIPIPVDYENLSHYLSCCFVLHSRVSTRASASHPSTRPRSCADLGRLAAELLRDACIPKDGGTVRTLHKRCQTAARGLQQFG
jgi:hypothetical protein